MRFPLRQATCLVPALLLIAVAPGCKPAPENVKVLEHVKGPPDLVKGSAANPADRSFQLSAFHLNHIWSAPHKAVSATYRAKVTVWDYSDDHSPVAELYFDSPSSPSEPMTDPNRSPRPYQIHFPAEMMGPILGTLRNANEPVFLYYYEGNWALGTYSAEPVGVD